MTSMPLTKFVQSVLHLLEPKTFVVECVEHRFSIIILTIGAERGGISMLRRSRWTSHAKF